MLPIILRYYLTGKTDASFLVEIDVHRTTNLEMFAEGVSATFRLLRVNSNGEKDLVYLIDNHAPFGFHEHDNLPDNHDSRVLINTNSWQEAWIKFQEKCREIIT